MDRDRSSTLQAHQIVCLADPQARLYAEVIQVMPQRQTCWVRPTLLVVADQVYNLDHCPDIIWPIAGFRPALDTEVIPLLGNTAASPLGCQYLRQFLHRLT
ncbi:MAG: hypothetical protein EA366_06930 [Spirulina sp. DLM2.Bin59]|nr:MAG: hypothetical protein EA366_06930 [Spirulina sp. DLM2.Bin59]